MRRWVGAWLWVMLLSGCAQTAHEHAREYLHDAYLQYDLGNYPAAQESYQAALKHVPDDVGVIYNVGLCYDRQSQFPQAEQHYLSCLQRQPDHLPSRHALIQLYHKTNRKAEAHQLTHAWLAQQPELAAPYIEDGWLYKQDGDLPRAQSRLQQALQREPNNARALAELGQVFEETQQPELALTMYERAHRLAPTQAELARRITELREKRRFEPEP